MRRRDFLQQAGLGLAALGLTETGLAIQAERYYQALAKPTARKLALLVGINQYSQQVYDPSPVGRARNRCPPEQSRPREWRDANNPGCCGPGST